MLSYLYFNLSSFLCVLIQNLIVKNVVLIISRIRNFVILVWAIWHKKRWDSIFRSFQLVGKFVIQWYGIIKQLVLRCLRILLFFISQLMSVEVVSFTVLNSFNILKLHFHTLHLIFLLHLNLSLSFKKLLDMYWTKLSYNIFLELFLILDFTKALNMSISTRCFIIKGNVIQ